MVGESGGEYPTDTDRDGGLSCKVVICAVERYDLKITLVGEGSHRDLAGLKL